MHEVGSSERGPDVEGCSESCPPNEEHVSCAECSIEESVQVSLTWAMRKQDVSFDTIEGFTNWMDEHEREGTVIVIPNEGDIEVSSAAPYCDDCLGDVLREYEDHHTPPGRTTKSEFVEQVLVELKRFDCDALS